MCIENAVAVEKTFRLRQQHGMDTKPLYLTQPGQHPLAYRQHAGKTPGILFCGGFRSDMNSSKAAALLDWCRTHDVTFTRFDYYAHGETGGDFAEFTIGQAIHDATAILDQATTGDQIVVGSSMGAWIALAVALERRDRVRGLITIAAAPDFTEKLMFAQMTPDQRRALDDEGEVWVPSDYGSDYPITRHFIHEARQHLMLDDIIGLDIPIHLFHGQEDPDVPWETTLQLAAKLMSDDVLTTLIKDGDHRLSRPQDLALLMEAVARIRATVA